MFSELINLVFLQNYCHKLFLTLLDFCLIENRYIIIFQFAGRWFDIESYFDDFIGDCKDGNFTPNENEFDVRFTQVVNDKLDITLGRAVMAIDNSGKLTININGGEYLTECFIK